MRAKGFKYSCLGIRKDTIMGKVQTQTDNFFYQQHVQCDLPARLGILIGAIWLRKKMFAYSWILTQAVIYLMCQVKTIVSLECISGSMVTPWCAGKPKKSSVGTACCLKHAEQSESGGIEATMQQTTNKGVACLVVATAFSPPLGRTTCMARSCQSSPGGLGALESCCVYKSAQLKTLGPLSLTALCDNARY